MTNEQSDAEFLRELAHYTSTLSPENEARVRHIADRLQQRDEPCDRVAGILTHMRRWLELTANRPLDKYNLDREAVSQLISRLAVEPTAGRCTHQHPERQPSDEYCRDCGEAL